MSVDHCQTHNVHTCHCPRPLVDPRTNQRVNKISYGVVFAGLPIRPVR